jgi:hypothetical protein
LKSFLGPVAFLENAVFGWNIWDLPGSWRGNLFSLFLGVKLVLGRVVFFKNDIRRGEAWDVDYSCLSSFIN